MVYFTNYAFYSNKGDITFRNETTNSCFSEWTNIRDPIKKDEILRIYYPIEYFGDIKYNTSPVFNEYKEYIEYFIETLNNNGFPINIGYSDYDFLCIRGRYNEEFYRETMKSIFFEINCNNYRTKAELKIILYILRYIWELGQPKAIISFKDIYAENGDFIDSFSKSLKTIIGLTGHTMNFPINMKTDSFKKYLDTLVGKDYKDNEIFKLSEYKFE